MQIPIAQFRFDATDATWTLHGANRNGKWIRYDNIDSKKDLSVLVDEVDADPIMVFWG